MNNHAVLGIGLITGMIIMFVLMVLNPRSLYHHSLEVINECEQALPRNQHCEIYAKPVEHK